MLRKDLKRIYDSLPNKEKTQWALEADYSSYQGLYRYLKGNGETKAYPRVINALNKVIGPERFKNLTSQVVIPNNNTAIDVEGFQKEMLDFVLNCTDLNELLKVKEVINLSMQLLDNQIERISLLNDMKKPAKKESSRS